MRNEIVTIFSAVCIALVLPSAWACEVCIMEAPLSSEAIVLGSAEASSFRELVCQVEVAEVLKGPDARGFIPVRFSSEEASREAVKSAGKQLLWFLRRENGSFVMTLPPSIQKDATEKLGWFRAACRRYDTLKGGDAVDGLELILALQPAGHLSGVPAERLFQTGTAKVGRSSFLLYALLRNNSGRTMQIYNFLADAPFTFVIQAPDGQVSRLTTGDLFPLAVRGKPSGPAQHDRLSLSSGQMVRLRSFASGLVKPANGMQIRLEFANKRSGAGIWTGLLLSNTVTLDFDASPVETEREESGRRSDSSQPVTVKKQETTAEPPAGGDGKPAPQP